MAKYLSYAMCVADKKLRDKVKIYGSMVPYCKGAHLDDVIASQELAKLIQAGKPLMAGRMGMFEIAVMRMYEYRRDDKYQTLMDSLYNCAGFFPNDTSYIPRFVELMKDSLREIDVLASNREPAERRFINKYCSKDIKVSKSLELFDVTRMEDSSWSAALKGKRVLVVTPFTESVLHQYNNHRSELFAGTDILPEFASISVYKSLMTIGDMRDDRFADWFEALAHMEKEILAMDFDVAILGCGAYGFPLAASIKRAGKQAVHMGGSLQILFGIMGKRWDGSRFGGKMREDVAKYYNDTWTYPLEERPADASKVEYGPYWGSAT